MAAQNLIELMAYKPFQYQQVNPINLEQLAKTANTLAEMHLKSVDTVNAARKAVYELPLNEKDEIYREQVANAIDNEIASYRADGDLAGDYERITNFVTNIMTSKEMRGRLKMNAEYQQWVKDLKGLKLPKSYEEYYIDNNPYEYKDTDDGTMPTWKPKIDFTPLPDEAKVVELAIRQTNPNKSGGYYNTYLTDEFGRRLDDWKRGGYVMGDNGYRVWLPPQKIASAIRTVIRNNPAVLDGYWSMYNMNRYYDNKHKDKNEYDYARQIPLNSDGYEMGFNEWLDWRFKPIADNMSYYEGYPPTAAMRNLEAGIQPRSGRSNNGGKPTDPAKAAAKAEKQQINATTNELIAQGLPPARAKKEAISIVKGGNNSRSSSSSGRNSNTNNKTSTTTRPSKGPRKDLGK